MRRAILIHANCVNSDARGDFVFAGNIAKDIVRELDSNGHNDIKVFLVSALDGVARFHRLYGPVVDGYVSVEGTRIGVSSLEEFDAVENTVVAFIDANRCKHSAADLVKRVLAPNSKIMFVGNMNRPDHVGVFSQIMYRAEAKRVQPNLYGYFNDDDMLIGSAGLGKDRFGLPTITKAEDLAPLSIDEQAKLPTGDYGFMYVSAVMPDKDFRLIAQFMKLTGKDKYVLVGDFASQKYTIEHAYRSEGTLISPKPFPHIEYHQSLAYPLMRQTVANSSGALVLSTGVASTLEAMQDSKLTFYQDLSNNENFVTAYLESVKSCVVTDSGCFCAMPKLIIDLSSLLFESKPLSQLSMEKTRDLLQMPAVCTRLIEVNQRIIRRANGQIATRLLNFLGQPRKTIDQAQLAEVCMSLRKMGENGTPMADQALRRAATWGRLFELKVLIKSLTIAEMNKTDPRYLRTALHWAVIYNRFDCVRLLIKTGVSLDLQDNDGQTPLHKAVVQGDRAMIKLLIEAGASVDISDKNSQSPESSAPDEGTLYFIRDCHSHLSPRTT